MYELFTNSSGLNTKNLIPPEFNYVKKTYIGTVNSLLDYFNNSKFIVKSNHLLVKIIRTSEISMEFDDFRYHEIIDEKSKQVAKAYNLTSETTYGRFHNSVFFKNSLNEIILSVNDYANPIESIKNWKNLKPVVVLEHDDTDLGLPLLNGTKEIYHENPITIGIDIPLLMLMYRGYYFNQKTLNRDLSLDPIKFIANFVIPNIIFSYIDLVIRNRMINLHYGAPNEIFKNKHKISIINYSTNIDKINRNILKVIKGNKNYYEAILKNIPSIYVKPDEQSDMPDYPKTRQVWWALLVSRIRLIRFVIDVGGEKSIPYNKTLLNRFKIDLKRFNNDNGISIIKNKTIATSLEYDLDYILNL